MFFFVKSLMLLPVSEFLTSLWRLEGGEGLDQVLMGFLGMLKHLYGAPRVGFSSLVTFGSGSR